MISDLGFIHLQVISEEDNNKKEKLGRDFASHLLGESLRKPIGTPFWFLYRTPFLRKISTFVFISRTYQCTREKVTERHIDGPGVS